MPLHDVTGCRREREGGEEGRVGRGSRGREKEREGEERENGMFINMHMNGMCMKHTHTTSKFVHKWSALCHSSLARHTSAVPQAYTAAAIYNSY